MEKKALFYCTNNATYPPFKNGLYMEEYFCRKWFEENLESKNDIKRLYIPVLWTNLQIQGWFHKQKDELQKKLDQWIEEHPSEHGYFTVVQYDDGPLLKLPQDTVVYGACSNDIPLPWIYEDVTNRLESIPKKTFREKQILCSFVGSKTCNNVKPNVRETVGRHLSRNKNFKISFTKGWSAKVKASDQTNYINTTVNSKFALAPRGYGRSAPRFFEVFKMGTIPIYIWNDVNWLPYQDTLDYSKFCFVFHVSEIHKIESAISKVTEEEYYKMFEEYEKIKHLFELKGMCEYIISNISK